MLSLYKGVTSLSAPLLKHILKRRLENGKECPDRYQEKTAHASLDRPHGFLVWVHAASVGEVQSALILINKILEISPHVLVTTGTLTSARLIERRLPKGAFHQYYPLDHPKWVERFLNHWQPNFILWMESELWPNMLSQIKKRNVPAIMVNAQMSPKSVQRWSYFPQTIQKMLLTFQKILCQTKKDAKNFEMLGAKHTATTDNLKYSAAPLSFDQNDLNGLKQSINGRPVWLYASTHKGEEEIASDVHKSLKNVFPDILTIIIPRHPERADQIIKSIQANHNDLDIRLRGHEKKQPHISTDIYIVNTMGELGLFYTFCGIACIGRTFSDDGGGGHNPIEAAQLDCGVMHGENVQNLQDIFDEMNHAQAAIKLKSPKDLENKIQFYLQDDVELNALKVRAKAFAKNKERVIDRVLNIISPKINAEYQRYTEGQADVEDA